MNYINNRRNAEERKICGEREGESEEVVDKERYRESKKKKIWKERVKKEIWTGRRMVRKCEKRSEKEQAGKWKREGEERSEIKKTERRGRK